MTAAPRHTVPVLLLLSAVASPSFTASTAHAALVTEAGPPMISLPAGDPLAAPRVQLPGSTARAQRFSQRAGSEWLLGVSGDPAELRRTAARFGGSYDAGLRLVRVPGAQGNAAAKALGSAVRWAGPDVQAERNSSFDDPGGALSTWSRSAGGAPSLTPAIGSLATIGIVDDAVDKSVAELAGIDVINGVTPAEPHGTMVASTAAAPYDATGVVGVAPGAKVLSWGTSLSCSDVADGIRQVVRRGAKVVNLSLGFDTPCWPLFEQISFAYVQGVTVVAASGNDGDNGNPPSYPASYPHVITAAAITPSLAIATFSNHNDAVDIAAPGVDVPVDVPLSADLDDGVRDGRTTVSGTSFAAPFVTGGISWLLGSRRTLDPSQVAAILRASSRDLETPGWDPYTGYGLLQISGALAVATPTADPYEPNDDPAITRSAGTFRQPTVWSGKAAKTIVATGDSADDSVDAYRVRVPARGRVRVALTPSEGYANLFAFRGSIDQFVDRRPITASTKSGSATDRITIRNNSRSAATYFVVVNTINPTSVSRRYQSRYALRLTK